MKYYVDTCIWLNLFKKEERGGVQYWRFVHDFLEKIVFSETDHVVYSGIVLRELQILLGSAYDEKRKWFENETKFVKVDVLQADKEQARKWESAYFFEISFYDLLHLAVCKRLDLHLVTRDNYLTNIARENKVLVSKPEEL